jgi:two-component system, OmpR family, alkaline phosphatase synthesis response regulator PhoP
MPVLLFSSDFAVLPFGKSTAFAPRERSPIMAFMPQNKILIADDNNTNVELLEAYLDGVECEIAVAVDGLDTLAKVAEFQPDLILLDIMMPKMSGFEVCKTLKRDLKTRQIMILMVTALNELGDIERAVVAGCDDFLSKPVNKIELVKRVENMLKLRHVTDELERLRRYIDTMEDRGEGRGVRGEGRGARDEGRGEGA